MIFFCGGLAWSASISFLDDAGLEADGVFTVAFLVLVDMGFFAMMVSLSSNVIFDLQNQSFLKPMTPMPRFSLFEQFFWAYASERSRPGAVG